MSDTKYSLTLQVHNRSGYGPIGIAVSYDNNISFGNLDNDDYYAETYFLTTQDALTLSEALKAAAQVAQED